MGKHRIQYTKSDVTAALKDIDMGMSVYKSSLKYKIPKTTLMRKRNDTYSVDSHIGHPTVLTPHEEGTIKNWIIRIAEAGFPATKDQLLDSVQLLILKLNRPNNFKNGRPGRRWYEGFLKRYPDISERVAQHLTNSHASVTVEKLRSWFQNVKSYFNDNNLTNVITDASRIFNCDESAFFLAPKENCVLAKKGEKAVYNCINNDEKECLTTLIMACADGTLPSPMIVFNYKRIPLNLVRTMPREWGIGKSESGWMTGEVFFEYVANVFLPWLKQNNVTFPVVLFVDGHCSHLTLSLSEFCKENAIILIAIFPNSTHLIQPLDVAVFRPLKQAWKNAVHNWRINNYPQKLKKENFGPLLSSVLYTAANPTTIQSDFRTTGLFPFDSEAVNYDKLIQKQESSLQSSTPISKRQTHLVDYNQFHKDLESFLPKTTIDKFTSSESKWTGPLEDQNLFYLWKSAKEKIENANMPSASNVAINSDISVCGFEPINQNLDVNQTKCLNMEFGDTTLDNNIDLSGALAHHSRATLTDIEGVGQVLEVSMEELITTPTDDFMDQVGTPFKESFFWPKTKEEAKAIKRTQKIVPSVIISSDAYISYYDKKEREKDRVLKERLGRKQKREAQKIKKNIYPKKQKTIEKTSTVTSGIEDSNKPEIKDGQYVIVNYEGEYFPGIVLAQEPNGILVKVMVMSGSNWKWPEKEDKFVYPLQDVISVIAEPELINARRVSAIKEISELKNNK